MDIINQLECDSSSDSDGIVMEDRVAEEDGDLREKLNLIKREVALAKL